MLKGHPKGLFVAFFTNMGERFGYYTMLAIFLLYLQSKFGWSTAEAGRIYGFFLFGVYFLPLLGGFIADNILGYGKTILLGIIVMFIGYGLLAMPGTGEYFIYLALVVISLGTGLFKGNLQALVGNMYDDPKYSKYRDSAFNVFYMGINIGAFFAPSAAGAMRNWILSRSGFTYDSAIPSLAHKYLNHTLENTAQLEQFARSQAGGHFTDLAQFCQQYIHCISQAYNAGFAVAGISMIASLLIFIGFRKYYKSADVTHKQQKANKSANLVELTPAQTKDRLVALGLVFFVVMFFWMAFHQNGFTLTIFARDYTVSAVSKGTAVIFNLSTLLPVLVMILGIVLLFGKNNSSKMKITGGALAVISLIIAYFTISSLPVEGNKISPEIFQQFNPIFIVFLTPVILGPSGCGKTTLLKCMNRLTDLYPELKVSGEIMIGDRNVFDPDADIYALRQSMGLLSQRPYPLPMTIYNNIAYALKLRGIRNRRLMHKLVMEYLRQAALYDEVRDRLREPASRLSIGQQQRLCLARGLAVNPDIILADEPTSALDPISSRFIDEKFQEIKKDYTIVVVTHIMRQAKRLADNVIFMYLGEVIEQGPAREFFENPRQEKTKLYLEGMFT